MLALCLKLKGRTQTGAGTSDGLRRKMYKDVTYFANAVLRSPMKARVAPLTAVFRQPKRSVNMLTTGEQKKIMPMAKAPTQAAEEKEFIVRNKWKYMLHKQYNCMQTS